MSQLQQVCERINDTFVVKCVEQIQPETYLGLEISDLISAIIALFSVLAAGFAGYAAWKANKLSESEAKANREHRYLSLRPYLEINAFGKGEDTSIELTLHNHGLGPAILNKIAFQYDGGEVFDSINSRDPFENLCHKVSALKPLSCNWITFTENTAMSPDSEIKLITFECDENFNAKKIRSIISKLDIKLFYSDIYNSEELRCSADCLKY